MSQREGIVSRRAMRAMQTALFDFETEMLEFGLVPTAEMQQAFEKVLAAWQRLTFEANIVRGNK